MVVCADAQADVPAQKKAFVVFERCVSVLILDALCVVHGAFCFLGELTGGLVLVYSLAIH